MFDFCQHVSTLITAVDKRSAEKPSHPCADSSLYTLFTELSVSPRHYYAVTSTMLKKKTTTALVVAVCDKSYLPFTPVPTTPV